MLPYRIRAKKLALPSEEVVLPFRIRVKKLALPSEKDWFWNLERLNNFTVRLACLHEYARETEVVLQHVEAIDALLAKSGLQNDFCGQVLSMRTAKYRFTDDDWIADLPARTFKEHLQIAQEVDGLAQAIFPLDPVWLLSKQLRNTSFFSDAENFEKIGELSWTGNSHKKRGLPPHPPRYSDAWLATVSTKFCDTIETTADCRSLWGFEAKLPEHFLENREGGLANGLQLFLLLVPRSFIKDTHPLSLIRAALRPSDELEEPLRGSVFRLVGDAGRGDTTINITEDLDGLANHAAVDDLVMIAFPKLPTRDHTARPPNPSEKSVCPQCAKTAKLLKKYKGAKLPPCDHGLKWTQHIPRKEIAQEICRAFAIIRPDIAESVLSGHTTLKKYDPNHTKIYIPALSVVSALRMGHAIDDEQYDQLLREVIELAAFEQRALKIPYKNSVTVKNSLAKFREAAAKIFPTLSADQLDPLCIGPTTQRKSKVPAKKHPAKTTPSEPDSSENKSKAPNNNWTVKVYHDLTTAGGKSRVKEKPRDESTMNEEPKKRGRKPKALPVPSVVPGPAIP